MNLNFGLFPPLTDDIRNGRKSKRDRTRFESDNKRTQTETRRPIQHYFALILMHGDFLAPPSPMIFNASEKTRNK